MPRKSTHVSKNLSKKQLLNLARKHYTGISKDFTKEDLLYNLSKLPQYAKPKKTTKTESKKSERKRPIKGAQKDSRGGTTRKRGAQPIAKNPPFLDKDERGISTRTYKQSNRGKKSTLKTEKIRGKNTFSIKARGKAENLAGRIKSDGLKKDLQYYLTKNRPKKGKPPKEPKAIVVITKIKLADGQTKTFSKISEPDFRVTKDSALEFIETGTDTAGDLFEELYGEEIDSILNVSVKFIY